MVKEVSSKAGRRVRVNYTPKQLSALESAFLSAQYPDPAVLESLSDQHDIPLHKLCTWFQNRRSKFRRDSKAGHIDWMRGQLYGSPPGGATSPPSHSPDGATTPAGRGSSKHVLSPTPADGGDTSETTPKTTINHRPQATNAYTASPVEPYTPLCSPYTASPTEPYTSVSSPYTARSPYTASSAYTGPSPPQWASPVPTAPQLYASQCTPPDYAVQSSQRLEYSAQTLSPPAYSAQTLSPPAYSAQTLSSPAYSAQTLSPSPAYSAHTLSSPYLGYTSSTGSESPPSDPLPSQSPPCPPYVPTHHGDYTPYTCHSASTYESYLPEPATRPACAYDRRDSPVSAAHHSVSVNVYNTSLNISYNQLTANSPDAYSQTSQYGHQRALDSYSPDGRQAALDSSYSPDGRQGAFDSFSSDGHQAALDSFSHQVAPLSWPSQELSLA